MLLNFEMLQHAIFATKWTTSTNITVIQHLSWRWCLSVLSRPELASNTSPVHQSGEDRRVGYCANNACWIFFGITISETGTTSWWVKSVGFNSKTKSWPRSRWNLAQGGDIVCSNFGKERATVNISVSFLMCHHLENNAHNCGLSFESHENGA